MKNDSQLQRDVMEELEWDPEVDHSQIGVTAKDGVVTLTGFVPNYAQKAAAEKAARSVAGVKAIAEEIEVRFPSDPKTSDAEIAKRVLDIFQWDVAIPRDRLMVKVEHGWVYLTGQVEWNYQKETAQRAVGRITGVKGVSNQITVRARTSSYDVRQRIIDAFKRSSTLDANEINVTVSGSKVTLGGRVHAFNERKVAENAAWSASGVTEVEDNIILA